MNEPRDEGQVDGREEELAIVGALSIALATGLAIALVWIAPDLLRVV